MNSYLVVSCLLAYIAVGSANPHGLIPIATIETIPNSDYGFHYAVNDPSTGDNKAQWETRHGDMVQGAYSLVEPDGNIRVVEYTAGPHTGFNAVVKRTGPNIHSVSLPMAAPIAIAHHEPIAHVAPIAEVAPIAHLAPIAEVAPIHEVAPIAPIHEIEHVAPIATGPIYTPIIEHAPLIAPYDLLPVPIHAPQPWVSLSGTTYGHKGNIVRRWTAGPISLDHKTITIKTKH